MQAIMPAFLVQFTALCGPTMQIVYFLARLGIIKRYTNDQEN